MKKFRYIWVAAMVAVALVSCSKDDETPKPAPSPVPVPTPEALKTVGAQKTGDYTVRLQNTSGTFVMGYNELTLSVVDAHDKAVAVEAPTFVPWMEMFKGNGQGGFTEEVDFKHTCPHTPLTKEGGQWKAQALFQMMTGPSGRWFATLTFKVAGVEHKVERLTFEVKPQTNLALGKVNRFWLHGAKPQTHLYAIVAPAAPKVGENEVVLGIWKMLSYESFPVAEGLTVEVSLSEKGSTATLQKVTFAYADGFYRGKLSYPKAGEYVLRYTLKDAQGNIVQPRDKANQADVVIATEIKF